MKRVIQTKPQAAEVPDREVVPRGFGKNASSSKCVYQYRWIGKECRKATKKEILGGTHASPRPHLRRGHFRVYPDHTVWIKPTYVNVR